MTQEIPFRIRRTLHQLERQDDGLATLDRVEVLYDRLRETFHGDTMETAPSKHERSAHVKRQCIGAYKSPYGVMKSARFLSKSVYEPEDEAKERGQCHGK